ncbi:MAG TPA: DUF2782 domain-containing protein [Casimicrobiaceae bacterium]|nr:DUF2782 domain-containing protein [Casimicrobiaceae bacterium]
MPLMIRHAPGLSGLLAMTVFAVAVAWAQPAPPPPKLEPLPDVPPPPGVSGEEELQPQVTITQRQGEKVEEARVNGRLVWVRVTPRHGRPYFLIPDPGGNTYIRRDSNDTGLKVPLWVLFSF